jgi:predicted Zn-dependent peptidase
MRWSDAARRLVVAWPTARVGSPEDDALDLAVTVLANGRMSRLWRRLVLDEGLATSVSASNDSRVEAGVLWIFAETAQDAEPAELERALHEEIASLSARKVTADELERARALLLAGEAFDGETVTDVAEGLGEWAVDDDWRRAFDGGARHARVSSEDLRATAARLLLPERRVVGWCFPKEEAGKAKKRAEPKRAARAARIRRKVRAARRPRR